MKRLVQTLALTCTTATCGALVACARDDAGPVGGLRGETWQVVSLHTYPDAPTELPADAAGKASLRFSANSLAATTGCAPLRAGIDTEATNRGERITLTEVEVGDASECIGGSRHVHDTLAGMLVPGAAFDVRLLGDREATLTLVSEELNKPAIRVMAL